MGHGLTKFENRSSVNMEIRVFVPPARPDHYRMIIRIEPGETKEVKTKKLFCMEISKNNSLKNPSTVYLIVFMDGVYGGVMFLPSEVSPYAKIIGYQGGDTGGVILKGVRICLPSFCKPLIKVCKLSFWRKFKKEAKWKCSSTK